MDVFARTSLGGDAKGADAVILPMRVGLSASYDREYAPFLSPGLKAQVSFFPLGGMLKESVLMFDVGGRIFDGIRFGHCELEPFIGYAYSMAAANAHNYGAARFDAGLEAIFGSFGIECAYLLPGESLLVPAFGALPSSVSVISYKGLVRLGLSLHLKRR
jgi:hypothetical protein